MLAITMPTVTEFSRRTIGATSSQFFGFMLDAYDLTIVLAQAALLATVFFPPSSKLLASFGIIFSYSLTIIARPLGSAIFGNIGDRIGRRNTLLITIVGFSLVGALTAALPTYASIGVASFIMFSIIRFVVGIFAGGEYAAGHPFVMEWTPGRFRGVISGFVQGGFSIGAAIAAAVVGLLLALYGKTGFVQFAWRYMFLTALIPMAIAIMIRLVMPETPVFRRELERGRIEHLPIVSLFRKPVIYDFLQVMVIMTGLFFYAYVLFAYVPAIMEAKNSTLPGGLATTILTYATISAFFGALSFGALSQKVGRRRLGIIWAIMTLFVAIPLYYALFSGSVSDNRTLAIISAVIIGYITQGPWGVVPVYLSERFRTSHRASGVGFGYSSGIFIGGWFSVYIPLMHNYLFKSIDTHYNVWFSTAVLLMMGAVLMGVGFYLGPETVGTDLSGEK